MVDTTIDVGNAYVTNGSIAADIITTTGDQVVVKLSVGSAGPVEYVSEKTLIEVPRLRLDPAGEGGSDTPTVSVKDLLNMKEIVTVNGYLEEEEATSAISKRDDLKALNNYGKVISVVWGKSADSEQQLFVGSLKKLVITEEPNRIVNSDRTIASGRPIRGLKATVSILVAEDLN